MGNCVISYNYEKKLYVVMVNKKPVGPLTLNELRAMVENIHDVLDLRGRYVFIDEYDVYGDKINEG